MKDKVSCIHIKFLKQVYILIKEKDKKVNISSNFCEIVLFSHKLQILQIIIKGGSNISSKLKSIW